MHVEDKGDVYDEKWCNQQKVNAGLLSLGYKGLLDKSECPQEQLQTTVSSLKFKLTKSIIISLQLPDGLTDLFWKYQSPIKDDWLDFQQLILGIFYMQT